MINFSIPITNVNSIAERLKQSRESKGLTQSELGGLAGVSQGTIGNIESGLRKNPRELLALAKALGKNPEWLKSGKGPENADVAATPGPWALSAEVGVQIAAMPEQDRFFLENVIRGLLKMQPLAQLDTADPPNVESNSVRSRRGASH